MVLKGGNKASVGWRMLFQKTITIRKLASIQRIKIIEPIANADTIMKATVLGWQLVIKESKELVSFKAISNEFLLKYGE